MILGIRGTGFCFRRSTLAGRFLVVVVAVVVLAVIEVVVVVVVVVGGGGWSDADADADVPAVLVHADADGRRGARVCRRRRQPGDTKKAGS